MTAMPVFDGSYHLLLNIARTHMPAIGTHTIHHRSVPSTTQSVRVEIWVGLVELSFNTS